MVTTKSSSHFDDAALQHDLDDLMRKYTEEHPDVVATRRLIANLGEQRITQLDLRKKATGGGTPATASTDGNPVFQQLRISLADAEANVAAAFQACDLDFFDLLGLGVEPKIFFKIMIGD